MHYRNTCFLESGVNLLCDTSTFHLARLYCSYATWLLCSTSTTFDDYSRTFKWCTALSILDILSHPKYSQGIYHPRPPFFVSSAVFTSNVSSFRHFHQQSSQGFKIICCNYIVNSRSQFGIIPHLVDYVNRLFRQLRYPLLCFLFLSSIWISAKEDRKKRLKPD